MRRLVSLLALAAALIPATASAAPFGELPSRTFGGESSCVAATGAPGELVRDVVTARGDLLPPALVRIGADGATASGSVPVDVDGLACPSVAASPDGTAIAAGIDKGKIDVAARPAGGDFGPPQPLTGARAEDVDHLTVAVSARGDALVAWREKSRIRYAVRPAGQPFGAPRDLAAGATDRLRLSAGMSAAGEAVIVWSTLIRTGYHQLPVRQRVRAAFAPPGGAFGPPQTVAAIAGNSAPALAVGDDGRALLTLPDCEMLRLAERPPGGSFGAPVSLVHVPGPLATAVAAGPGGRAAVAWNDVLGRSGGVMTRSATGPFGRGAAFARGPALTPRERFADELLASLLGDERGPFDSGFVAVTLTPDATTAAWLTDRRVHGLTTAGVQTATLSAAGGAIEGSVVGGGLHDAESLVGFPAASGGAGVAWLEPDTRRLRTAVAGAAPAAGAPAPTLHVRRPGPAVVKFGGPLVLHVSCSAACEVRGQIGGHAADGELSLARAGNGRLAIAPEGALIGSARGTDVTVRLLYGAPGATRPRARTLHVRVREAGIPTLSRPRDVRARRVAGDRIKVTWTTRVSSPEFSYLVTGSATRGGAPRAVAAGFGRTGRRFTAVLHHVRGLRFSGVSTLSLGPERLTRPVVVRVR